MVLEALSWVALEVQEDQVGLEGQRSQEVPVGLLVDQGVWMVGQEDLLVVLVE